MNRKQLISQMYWKERAIAVSNQAHKRADNMEEGMLKALRLAESRIKRDIQSWYSKFAFDNEISMSEARKLLTEAELAEFKWAVDEYIELAKQYAGFGDPDWERRLANASARVHIQRLEALQLQIRAEIERATNEQQMIMSNGIPLIYEESYNKTLEALGETAAMSRVNTKAIEKIAEKPWTTDGKTFSGRIWENKEKLVNSLQTDLIQAVTRGDTHAEMTNRLAERMNTSRYNAGRLVRTETTYINARATQDAYKENNVEKVEIIGTLDSRVCALCSDMDGITIDMKTYEPGVTVPPFHPMCRCTTAPAVEDIPDDIFEQLDEIFEQIDDDEILNTDKIRGIINNERTLPSGTRRSKYIKLSDEDKAYIEGEIEAIQADRNTFEFRDSMPTGYDDESDTVFISANVFPSEDGSNHPTDLLSVRAVLAHEYYGHRANKGTSVPSGSWNDEFRASYMAARDCPNLTDEDRALLLADALHRAKTAGVKVNLNPFMRRILYGIDE